MYPPLTTATSFVPSDDEAISAQALDESYGPSHELPTSTPAEPVNVMEAAAFSDVLESTNDGFALTSCRPDTVARPDTLSAFWTLAPESVARSDTLSAFWIVAPDRVARPDTLSAF